MVAVMASTYPPMSSTPWNENPKSLRPKISIVTATESASTAQPQAIAAQRASGSTQRLTGLSMASVDAVAACRAHRGVPGLCALGIDLVAGLLPEGQHDGAHGRLHFVGVLGAHVDELHLELHSFLARLAADVAVDGVVVHGVGEPPHLLLHLAELRYKLGLLLRSE